MAHPIILATSDMNTIELWKENIQPIKSGYNLNQLNKQLENSNSMTSQDAIQYNNDNLHEYESIIEQYSDNDPLVPYLSYIEYLVNNQLIEQNHKVLIQVLERCSKLHTTQEQYKSDQRYIRIWLLYIDTIKSYQQCIDIFNYMKSNAIGSKNSLYYQAYAQLYMTQHMYNDAINIIKYGIDMCAIPINTLKNLLKRTVNKFESYKLMQQQKQIDNGYDILIDNSNTIERHVLSVKPTYDENNPPPLVNGVHRINHSHIINHKYTIPQQQQQSSTTQSVSNKSNFSVHTDDTTIPSTASVPWNNLSSQFTISKENQPIAGTWNQPLKPSSSTISSNDAAWQYIHNNKGSMNQQPIDIFIDDNNTDNTAQSTMIPLNNEQKGLRQSVGPISLITPSITNLSATPPAIQLKSNQSITNKPLIGLIQLNKPAVTKQNAGMNQLKSLALGKLSMKTK